MAVIAVILAVTAALLAWRMFAQIDHHKPLVNGYSGFFPQARGFYDEIIPVYTLFQLSIQKSH